MTDSIENNNQIRQVLAEGKPGDADTGVCCGNNGTLITVRRDYIRPNFEEDFSKVHDLRENEVTKVRQIQGGFVHLWEGKLANNQTGRRLKHTVFLQRGNSRRRLFQNVYNF